MHEARNLVKQLFDEHVYKALLPHLPGKTVYDADLIFADTKPDIENLIAKKLDEVAEYAQVPQ